MKTYIITIALLLTSITMAAQNSETAFFLEHNMYSHEINPAVGNDRGYIAMPLLGNTNVAVNSNIGLEDILYKRNGKLVTFMHESVSPSEFMKNIKDVNQVNLGLNEQIFGFGFKAFKGYNTVDINLRAKSSNSIPGEFLRIAKNGLENRMYSIDDLGSSNTLYGEVAFGHSHNITKKLRVGAKVKVLIGAANAEFEMDNSYVDLNPEKGIMARINGTLRASANSLTFTHDSDGSVDDVDIDEVGIGGTGIGFDLGAEYKVTDDLAIGVALIDLGSSIKWKSSAEANLNWTMNSDDYAYNDETEKFENAQGEEFGDAFDNINLMDKGDQGERTTKIGTTMNVTASYKMPFYRKLTVGAIYSSHFNDNHSWNNLRLSANVEPVKWFSAAFSATTGTYGSGIGCTVGLHPGGISLFVGMDYITTKLSKQFVPLRSNAQLSLGLNFHI